LSARLAWKLFALNPSQWGQVPAFKTHKVVYFEQFLFT